MERKHIILSAGHIYRSHPVAVLVAGSVVSSSWNNHFPYSLAERHKGKVISKGDDGRKATRFR